MDEYSVYMHVNKTNGKRYIGITSQVPSRRWHNGLGYKAQKRFYSAIQHYGWDGFEHLIIESGLAKETAEKREAELIAEYNSNDLRYGYNIENGGVIHKLSQEQIEHLREINRGRTHSDETKKKMSQSHIGLSTRWLVGSHQSDVTKRKRADRLSGANNPKAREVYQYNLDGTFVAKYSFMEEAKRALGLSSTAHISQCCLGTRGKAHGFMWSYELKTMPAYTRLWKGGIVHG